jgi:hypothetical protein
MKRNTLKNNVSVCLSLLWLTLTVSAAPADPLEAGFRNPPDPAKPLTWWHWLDGSVTREGITKDLESMKRTGLGGSYMFNCAMGMPQGPARFMGPEWLAMMDHAMKESSRLGLQFGIHNCDGWGTSGGPWITPETSMKQLTWTVKEVAGPARIDEKLAGPEARENFYRDIAVIAFPVPQGKTLTGAGSGTLVRGSIEAAGLAKLADGNPKTAADFPASRNGNTVEFEFSSPRTVRSVACRNIDPNPESGFPVTMEVSGDGKTFRKVGAFTPNWIFKQNLKPDDTITAACEEATGKVFRLTLRNSRPTSIGEIELSETARVHFFESKAALIRANGHGADRSRYDEFPGPDRGRVLPPGLTIPRDSVKNITAQMSADGHLQWDVPPGQWRIVRLGFTSNGRMIAPASPEGKGLDCDKLDAKTVRFHLEQYVGKIAGRPDRKSLVAMEIDSWECGIQNWTAGFEQRFRERTGYDLLTFMPTMLEGWVIDNADVSERVLWDWRRFLSDQLSENFFSVAQAFAKEKGLTYVGEATGRMQFLYDVAALRNTDVPMGEFWNTAGKGDLRVDNKAASSIAHITGKPVVASESYTSGGDAAGWDNHPYSLKALGDRAFCAGVNQYVFHTFAHQPYEVTGPGFTFGQWGLNFNRGNTWWEPARAWMEYLTRCNHMLRTGTPVADVLFHAGDDVPNYIGWRDELHPPLPAGYDFDGCDTRSLMEARVEKGTIILPGGTRYRVLLLPDLPTMRPAVLEKIRELVTAGAVVMGRRPEQSPCLRDTGAGDQALRKMAEELWGGAKPRVYSGISFEELFKRIHLPPDFEPHAVAADADVLYIHRRAGDAEIYFVSNQENRFEELNATFRAGNRAPELWDPATGEIRPLPDFRAGAGVVRVPLRLDPCGSAFIVFRGDRKPAEGKNWPELKVVRTIEGPWQVSFPPNLGAPATAIFDKLGSWSENSEPGIRFFSGTATYRTEFEWKPETGNLKPEIYLDLGQVDVMAEVELNGKSLGVLWKPPFRVRVDGMAKAGANQLAVKVTNLWRNRMIGDAALPDDDVEWKPKSPKSELIFPAEWPEWLRQGRPRPSGRITFCTRKDVYGAKDPLLESGLLGPVTLQTAETIPAK